MRAPHRQQRGGGEGRAQGTGHSTASSGETRHVVSPMLTGYICTARDEEHLLLLPGGSVSEASQGAD